MSLLRGQHHGYSKMDKEDPEEVRHRRAQFLIYKVLERADIAYSQRRRRSFSMRLRFSRLKMKIGKRLIKMRRGIASTLSKTRIVNAYKQRVMKQIKASCSRLFSRGESKPRINAPFIF